MITSHSLIYVVEVENLVALDGLSVVSHRCVFLLVEVT
jgi:hypothetical protein